MGCQLFWQQLPGTWHSGRSEQDIARVHLLCVHMSDCGTALALTLGGPLERAGIWRSGDLGSSLGSTHLRHVALFSSHLVRCPVSTLRPSI